MSIQFELPKLRADEKIEIFLRKHTMFLIVPLAVIIAIIIIPTIFIFYLVISIHFFNQPPIKNILIIIVSSYSLIMCGYALYIWFRYYFSYLIVTNQRLIEIEQKGLFIRNTSELELVRIEDVKALIHGVLATFFHYGDVLVETAGATTENFLFEKIPHASYVSSKILELSQRALEEQQPETGGRMASILLEGEKIHKDKNQDNQDIPEDGLSNQSDKFFSNLEQQELVKNNLINYPPQTDTQLENENKEKNDFKEEISPKNKLKTLKSGVLYEREKVNEKNKNDSGEIELK
ncbi:MAG: hypothetical protein ACPLYC_01820 [Minisyncoccia bacterium]